jgi:hypothetical protein
MVAFKKFISTITVRSANVKAWARLRLAAVYLNVWEWMRSNQVPPHLSAGPQVPPPAAAVAKNHRWLRRPDKYLIHRFDF